MPTKIVVEFAHPSARERARLWRKELIKAIDDAIANIEGAGGTKEKLFKPEDYAVNIVYE